jgi:uncharacterized protein (TIGR02145 family)
MNRKIRILIYPVLIMGVLLTLAISCNKNDPVIKKNVTITWANPADIAVGTQLSATQLNAKADVPGTFVYTRAIGASLAIGTNQILQVDFTPTDAANYNTATKTVTINVIAKKDPIITWANPTDITLGTQLSATQLNATSDVPGTFVYTPAIGSKLNVGANQDLKVDFTPTDAINNNTATKTVKINVTAIIVPGPNVTDVDGNLYQSVIIGTQTWMVENLKTTKYNDGTNIPNVTGASEWGTLTTGAYCWYNNDISYKATYGALYNWYAVNTGKLAPKGWHVPTDAEWSTLTSYLGGRNVDGGKLKETGTTHWGSPNTGATNETGFTALPGSGRNLDRGFYVIGYHGYWWSASEEAADFAWFRFMDFDFIGVSRASSNKFLGFSVRCVKD